MFDDHGDVADFTTIDMLLSSRMGRFAGLSASTGYGRRAMLCFTLNYIVGVGTLGLPYAFHKVGGALGTAALLGVACLTMITVGFCMEVCLRAAELPRMLSKQSRSAGGGAGAGRDIAYERSDDSLQAELMGTPECLWGRKLPELTQCCTHYLGTPAQVCFQVALTGLMFAGMTAYTQVFVHAVRTDIPVAARLSGGAVELVFAAIVLPLSCAELTEQVGVQTLMAAVNVLLLVLMMGSSLLAAFAEHEPSAEVVGALEHTDWSAAGLMFSTAVFSQLFQHSVPGLMRPLRAAEQRAAPAVFRTAIGGTALFYVLLGLSCSAYFGAAIRPACNLNWTRFAWPGGGGRGGEEAWWAAGLSQAIILFPALNTISVFPLIAITLGNNLMHYFPQLKRLDVGPNPVLDRPARRRLHTTCWRLVAALPPIIAALWVSDLSVTMQVAGLFGIYVAFVTPALLQLRSRARARSLGADGATAFEWALSGDGVARAVLAFAVVAMGVVLAQIAIALAGPNGVSS